MSRALDPSAPGPNPTRRQFVGFAGVSLTGVFAFTSGAAALAQEKQETITVSLPCDPSYKSTVTRSDYERTLAMRQELTRHSPEGANRSFPTHLDQ